MEKCFCLTSSLIVSPVFGMDALRLLEDFKPFYDFSLALCLSKKTLATSFYFWLADIMIV